MFSILVELILTSHEHLGRSHPHGSKNVPNLERRHSVALRVKFGPFKLNRYRFSKSSFMNPKSWMLRMWLEEDRFRFRLEFGFTPNGWIACRGGWIQVHCCLVSPVSIHSFATWVQFTVQCFDYRCNLRRQIFIFDKPERFFVMVMEFGIPQVFSIWPAFESSFSG